MLLLPGMLEVLSGMLGRVMYERMRCGSGGGGGGDERRYIRH